MLKQQQHQIEMLQVQMSSLQATVAKQGVMLKRMCDYLVPPEKAEIAIPFKFPLKTEENLVQLNKYMEENENTKKFVSLLQNIVELFQLW